MSEDASYTHAEADEMSVAAADDSVRGVRTGVASVDAVLAEIGGLDDRSVDEHVAVFERAHETLRAALDPDSAPDA